jgi:hypothetical protein
LHHKQSRKIKTIEKKETARTFPRRVRTLLIVATESSETLLKIKSSRTTARTHCSSVFFLGGEAQIQSRDGIAISAFRQGVSVAEHEGVGAAELFS